MSRAISIRQKEFIRYYIITKNVSEAARQAGYSHRSARGSGARCMANPYIRSEIARLLAEKVSEYKITKEQYEHKTLDLHKTEKQRNVKARYWELLGKAKGFIKPEGTQNIALFSELGKELQDKFDKVKDIKKNRQEMSDDENLLGASIGEVNEDGEGAYPPQG